jgi:hypothetical protein
LRLQSDNRACTAGFVRREKQKSLRSRIADLRGG